MVKVLIADDNNNNLYYLSSVLGAAGHEVLSAQNGQEALERLADNNIGLIISDILMPVMDGFTLCRECNTTGEYADIPFVFYTATYTGDEDRAFGLSLGAREYLIKPMEPGELLASIDKVMKDDSMRKNTNAGYGHVASQPDYLTEYNKRLIQKLGRKMSQVEESKRELEEERFKLRLLSDNAPFGMVLMNSEGRFTYVNKKFRDMFGYEPPDVPDGRSWLIHAYPDNKKRQEASVIWKEEMLGTGTPEPAKRALTVTCRDGSQKMVNFTPLKLESGDYLVTCEDITEVKKLEKQLQQSQKMEAIGSLAGGIAHDFNNILTTIMGYAGLLQMEMDKHNPLGLYVDQIINASQKAANLTRSLLAFSRQQPVVLNPVSVNDIINSAEKLLKRLLTEDIDFKVSLASSNMIIMADATQIDQILFNLVANARDALPEGGSLIIATSSTVIDKRFVEINGFGIPGKYSVITVSDTGTGMTEAIREKIFDPFFSTKEVGKGTGLGLSTVYGIVKQHNGFINVYSESGKGTTFRIYFPLARIDLAEQREETPVIRGGVETILIAEDNADLRRLVKEVLGKHGYRILEAVDGEDAIVKFGQYRSVVTLMIIDSIMPKKNGREVYDAVREIDPGVKVLFMSGHTRDMILSKGIEQSEFDFLPKPISPVDLLSMVRKILDRE